MFAKLREKLKGYKTIIANGVLAALAALYPIYIALSALDFTPVIPANYVALFAFGWALLGIVLRLVTTGPVGSKDA